MSGQRRLPCRTGQGLAGGDAQLLDDEVDPGDHLGDRMLDLEAGVHLEEEEFVAAAALIEHELDRSRPDVADGFRGRHRRRAQRARSSSPTAIDGALLQDLLVAPLDRAFALAEADGGAVGVGEELDLDVARPLEVALQENGRIAE